MYGRILLKNLHLKDLNPRVCGMRDCIPDQVIPIRRKEMFVLHYVTEGKGIHTVYGKEYPVGPGDIFLCRPGDLAGYRADPIEPFSYVWVGLDCGTYFSEFFSEPVLHVPWAQNIFSRIANIGPSGAMELNVCALLYEFFAKLEALSSPTATREDYVSQACNFIQSNYPEPISIGELAESLGLNRIYFCRIFKAQTGLSPQEYLVSLRLEKAAELLLTGELTQKEIAAHIGYPDVYSFSRMFRRRYGLAPGLWAAANKKSADR